MRKGIIVGVERKCLVILTAGGEFLKVKRPAGEILIGEEVCLPQYRNSYHLWNLAATAALLLLFLIPQLITAPGGVRAPRQTVVQVDINPSVELILDSNETVIDVYALNGDGRVLLEQLSLEGKDGITALEQILITARELGFLQAQNPDNLIIIAASPKERKDDDWETDTLGLQERMVAAAEGVISDTGAEILSLTADSQFRENAWNQGLSVGKMVVMMAAKEDGLNIPSSELKDNRVGDVIRNNGSDMSRILAHIQKSTPPGITRQDHQGQKVNPGRSDDAPGHNKGDDNSKGDNGNGNDRGSDNRGSRNNNRDDSDDDEDTGNSTGNEGIPNEGSSGNNGYDNDGKDRDGREQDFDQADHNEVDDEDRDNDKEEVDRGKKDNQDEND